jgi:hypothetical protein
MPAETPVTIPVAEPTEAIPATPLLHVPPATALLRVVVTPMHVTMIPPIVAGSGFTVTTVDVRQPVANA